MSYLNVEPYRIHFKVGAVFSFIGVGLWVLYGLKLNMGYPVQLHSQVMIYGFLLNFVCGFLMTAIPKMTGTKATSVAENIRCLALSLATLMFAFVGLFQLAYVLAAINVLLLFIFVVSRKQKSRGGQLPGGLLFIPFGLLSGLIGSIGLAIPELSGSFLGYSKILIYEGFVLNLILGLGSRLVPVVGRKSEKLMPPNGGAPGFQVNFNRLLVYQAMVLNLSFLVEAFVNSTVGLILRAGIVSFILFKNFRLHRPRRESTNLGRCLEAATISLPLTYLAILFLPEMRLHLIHILYILGYGLLTFMISIRVSLAHGGASLDLERSSRSIFVVAGLFILAMIFRAVFPVLNMDYYPVFYATAGTLFCVAVIGWAIFLGRSLRVRGPSICA